MLTHANRPLATALMLPLVALLFVSTPPARAATSVTDLSPVWSMRMNFQQAHQSPVGQAIVDELRRIKPNYDELWSGLVDTIGLDPRTDLGRVRVLAEGLDERDAIVLAELGDTTGKLEGWMLTLPGYDSQPLDDDTLLHTFLIDDNPAHQHAPHETETGPDGESKHRIHVALPQAPDGRYRIVASHHQGTTRRLAQAMIRGDGDLLGEPLAEHEILAARIHEMPLDHPKLDANQPGSAVLRSITAASMSLTADADAIGFSAEMQTTNPPRARQIAQLLEGLRAMALLGAAGNGPDPFVADLLDRVAVEHAQGTAALSVSVSMPQDRFEAWLRRMASEWK